MGLLLIAGGVTASLGCLVLFRRHRKKQEAKDSEEIAALCAQGLGSEDAALEIAEARRTKRAAVRTEGVRLVLIGSVLKAAGITWAIVTFLLFHNIAVSGLPGLLLFFMGGWWFIRPGLGRILTGRRRGDELE